MMQVTTPAMDLGAFVAGLRQERARLAQEMERIDAVLIVAAPPPVIPPKPSPQAVRAHTLAARLCDWLRLNPGATRKRVVRALGKRTAHALGPLVYGGRVRREGPPRESRYFLVKP